MVVMILMSMVYFINGIWNSKYKAICSMLLMTFFEISVLSGSGWWDSNEDILLKISAVFIGIFGLGIMSVFCIMHESLLTELCMQIIQQRNQRKQIDEVLDNLQESIILV